MGRRPILFIPTFFVFFLSYFARFCIQWGQTRRARISEGGDTLGNRIGREGAALIVLTLALCAVFALSVQMYDTLEAETADGALAAAADAARGFLSENEAVAAFLGFSADKLVFRPDAVPTLNVNAGFIGSYHTLLKGRVRRPSREIAPVN